MTEYEDRSETDSEKPLIDSEEKYRLLFHRMVNGFANHEIILDDNGKPVDYAFLEVNEAFEKYTGLLGSEILGKRITELFPGVENDPEDWISLYGRVAVTGDRLQFERFYKDTGLWFSVTAFQLVEGQFVTILEDITERRKATETLKEREWQLRTIVNHSSDVFYIHDIEGNLSFASQYIKKIFGYGLEDLKSRWDTIVTDNPMNLHGRELTQRALETGVSQKPYVLEIKHANGDIKYIEINESPFRDEKGEIAGLTGAARDVTQRILAERERERLQQELNQSQKMEAIGRLAGGIAHDFNNLMTIVTGYCEILSGKLKDNQEVLLDIEEINRAGQRATELTSQLLAFSRKQILELENFNLKDVVQGMEKMLRRLIGEDIDLKYLPHDCTPTIKADRGQVQQILMNLAINARDAMPKGGKLTLEIGCIEIDEEYFRTQTDVELGSYVLLAISDNGVGMDEDVRSKLFEPFFTTKEKGKGTGLGLSTVYGIVRQMGGNINVYSEPGIGTSFKIYLPRIEMTDTESAVLKKRSSITKGTETILIVEDDDGVRSVILTLLEDSGYRILEAADGKAALDIYNEKKDEIDLLLTDVIMPEFSGHELAERIKKSTPNLKVLFMSGYTDNAIQHSGVLLPGTEFIHKPFSLNSLSSKIREVLDST